GGGVNRPQSLSVPKSEEDRIGILSFQTRTRRAIADHEFRPSCLQPQKVLDPLLARDTADREQDRPFVADIDLGTWVKNGMIHPARPTGDRRPGAACNKFLLQTGCRDHERAGSPMKPLQKPVCDRFGKTSQSLEILRKARVV